MENIPLLLQYEDSYQLVILRSLRNLLFLEQIQFGPDK